MYMVRTVMEKVPSPYMAAYRYRLLNSRTLPVAMKVTIIPNLYTSEAFQDSTRHLCGLLLLATQMHLERWSTIRETSPNDLVFRNEAQDTSYKCRL